MYKLFLRNRKCKTKAAIVFFFLFLYFLFNEMKNKNAFIVFYFDISKRDTYMTI